MRRVIGLENGADLAGFRQAARMLLSDDIVPDDVMWNGDGMPNFFGLAEGREAPPVMLPRLAAEMIERVVCHRDPERYALLYQLIWRVGHGEPALLEVQSDPLVNRLELLAKAVRRDIHKMHAFLRFRHLAGPDEEERFVAWFQPDHFILEAAAPFFVERFRSLAWSIITPIGSLSWNGDKLLAGPAGRREDTPAEDQFEEGWRGYYESTFNPARLNSKLMSQQMPKKYWQNMPETRAIPEMVRTAPARIRDMLEKEAVEPTKRDPEKAVLSMLRRDDDPKTLEELNRLIVASEPLVPEATQAVLGEGPPNAVLAFVGEQPGDQEDIAGRPFVGPAGQMLSRAMSDAGIVRENVYLTNAVKHFKFEERGKRRLHMKPTAGEVKHYRWWLLKELELVQPKVVVALGATALLSLMGKSLPIMRNRGPMEINGRAGFVTIHPSYLLRLPSETERRDAYDAFVDDLKRINLMSA